MRKLLFPLLFWFSLLPAVAQVQITGSAVQIGGANSGGTPPGGSPGEVQYYCLTGGAIFCGDFTSTDGNGNITLHSVYASNATQGVIALGVGTGPIPTPNPTNYAGWVGPASGTPAYLIALPLAQNSAASLLNIGVPSTVNGLTQAVATFEAISDFAKVGSNNTFSGTQTFNNVTVTGTCTGCGGGGGSGNYTNLGGSVTWSGCTYASGVCVASGASSVTISSIPGASLDLIVKATANTSNAAHQSLLWVINGDTGSHYDWGQVYGGTLGVNATHAENAAAMDLCTAAASGLTPGSLEVSFLQYAGTTAQKMARCNGGFYLESSGVLWNDYAGDWQSTAAITSITITPAAGTFTGTIAVYGTN